MIKKTFTFLFASFLTLALFAADLTNRITVSFAGNSNYELRIDGRRYNTSNNRIYLNDMRPGRHSIQVYALNNRNRRSARPVYAAQFTVRPQYDMHISVDRAGRAHFEERRSGNHNDRDWKGGNDNRYDRDRNSRDEMNDRDWNRDNDNRRDNHYSRAMTDYDYSQLVQRIRGQWMGSSKYNTAKEAITRSYFNTQQVSGLLQLFSSESQRLELAKLGYSNTVDKQNYNQLYALFSRSGQIALDRYTQGSRY